MRYKDIRTYLKLRPFVRNAWSVVKQRYDAQNEMPVYLRNGIALYLRKDTQDYTIFRRIFARDEYHVSAHTSLFAGTVLDIGANVGMFTARITAYTDRIICYEPMRSNFAQLCKNTRASTHITPVHAAVGATNGTTRMYAPCNTTLSGGYTQFPHESLHGKEAFEDVEMVSLDDVFARHSIDTCAVLKLDAEGAEYDILYNAHADTLARIRAICGEYHAVEEMQENTTISALSRYLESHGFSVRIEPKKNSENHGLFFALRNNSHTI